MDYKRKITNKIEDGFLGQEIRILAPEHILKIKNNQLSKNLYPTAIGFYPKARFHERHRKNGCEEFILLYCIEGEGWIELNKEKQTLKANTFCILPRLTPHQYGSSTTNPWSIYWVHFTGNYASPLYERYAANDFPNIIPYNISCINEFQVLLDLLENDFRDYVLEKIHIHLLQFLSMFIYKANNESTRNRDSINESITFMKNNIDKKISIQNLAEIANYSITHYSELFRNQTGYSPIHYFLKLKIQLACQYLYFTQMNIKEICKKIGIEDQYYFSRMFKKQISLSPMQYRKKHKS